MFSKEANNRALWAMAFREITDSVEHLGRYGNGAMECEIVASVNHGDHFTTIS